MDRTAAENRGRVACSAATAGSDFNPYEREEVEDPPEEDTGIMGWNTGFGL